MTKWIATAATVCAGTALMLAQAPSPSPPFQGGVARSAGVVTLAQAGEAKTYRAFLNQYCVGCHNTKTPQPTSHPVDLEKANLDNVLDDAET